MTPPARVKFIEAKAMPKLLNDRAKRTCGQAQARDLMDVMGSQASKSSKPSRAMVRNRTEVDEEIFFVFSLRIIKKFGVAPVPSSSRGAFDDLPRAVEPSMTIDGI